MFIDNLTIIYCQLQPCGAKACYRRMGKWIEIGTLIIFGYIIGNAYDLHFRLSQAIIHIWPERKCITYVQIFFVFMILWFSAVEFLSTFDYSNSTAIRYQWQQQLFGAESNKHDRLAHLRVLCVMLCTVRYYDNNWYFRDRIYIYFDIVRSDNYLLKRNPRYNQTCFMIILDTESCS